MQKIYEMFGLKGTCLQGCRRGGSGGGARGGGSAPLLLFKEVISDWRKHRGRKCPGKSSSVFNLDSFVKISTQKS